jgi:hypothetical protein
MSPGYHKKKKNGKRGLNPTLIFLIYNLRKIANLLVKAFMKSVLRFYEAKSQLQP